MREAGYKIQHDCNYVNTTLKTKFKKSINIWASHKKTNEIYQNRNFSHGVGHGGYSEDLGFYSNCYGK